MEKQIRASILNISAKLWKRSRHDAGVHGSELVKKLLGRTEAFSFPKSLYAVDDTIFPFVRSKPDALILDFFAGSGTTFHAVALMNSRDEGSRRCISVTNNEVSHEQHKELSRMGFFAGDQVYEQKGVAEAVICRAAKQLSKDIDQMALPLKENILTVVLFQKALMKISSTFVLTFLILRKLPGVMLFKRSFQFYG